MAAMTATMSSPLSGALGFAKMPATGELGSLPVRKMPAAGGYSIDSNGPEGMAIFVKLAKSFGRTFVFGDKVPSATDVDPQEVVVVVADGLSAAETTNLQAWVRNGGNVVAIGYGFYSGTKGAVFVNGRAQQSRDRCTISALDGIATANFSDASPYQQANLDGDVDVCFASAKQSDNSSSAFVHSYPVGAGRVTSIASIQPFLNKVIATDDNAALVTALVAPTRSTKVHLIGTYFTSKSGQSGNKGNSKSKSNTKPQDDRSLLDLVSPGIKQGFLQLLLAFLLYAAWRSRRVGRPTRETLPISIHARDLTTARGALLAKAKRPASAASRLQDRTVADVVRRTGLPADHVIARLRSDGSPSPATVDTDVKLAFFASDIRRDRDWSAPVATEQNLNTATNSGENE